MFPTFAEIEAILRDKTAYRELVAMREQESSNGYEITPIVYVGTEKG